MNVRIQVTKTVGEEYNEHWRIADKGDILDGWIDKKVNFRKKVSGRFIGRITIYPTHFKILGKFYFRKSK